MELVYSLWQMPCISMSSGSPVLTVNALSTKLDGITPCISPVLSESQWGAIPYSLPQGRIDLHEPGDLREEPVEQAEVAAGHADNRCARLLIRHAFLG